MNRHPRTCITNLFHGKKKKLKYVNKQRYSTKQNAKTVEKLNT